MVGHVDMLAEECENFDTIIIGPGENNFKLALKKQFKQLEDKYTNVRFQTPYPERNLPIRSVISKEMFKQYGDYNATNGLLFKRLFYKCSYFVYIMFQINYVKSGMAITKEIEYLKKNFNVMPYS